MPLQPVLHLIYRRLSALTPEIWFARPMSGVENMKKSKVYGVHFSEDKVGTRESFQSAIKLPKTTFKAGKLLCLCFSRAPRTNLPSGSPWHLSETEPGFRLGTSKNLGIPTFWILKVLWSLEF